MKKKILIAAGIVVVLLVAVLLILQFVGSKTIALENTDLDSRYPYQMMLTKNGLVVDILDEEEGYRWTASSSNASTFYPVEQAAKKEHQSFLIKPLSGGYATVDFVLMNPETTDDLLYRIYLNLMLENDEITILGNSHQQFTGLITGIDDRYTIAQQDDGSFVVCMKAAMGADWSVPPYFDGAVSIERFDPSGIPLAELPNLEAPVEHSGPAPDRNSIETPDTYYRIESIEPQAAEVQILNRTNGEYLQLTFDYNDTDGLTLRTHEMLSGHFQEQFIPGDWNLPENSVISEISAGTFVSQVSGAEANTEQMLFTFADNTWILTRSESLTRDDFSAADYEACMSDQEAGEDILAMEEEGVRYYKGRFTLIAAWDANGYGYQLSSMLPVELEVLQNAVANLIGAES